MPTVRRLRKQLRYLKSQEKRLKDTIYGLKEEKPIDFLPKNEELEHSLAIYLKSNRDSRANLHLVRQFVHSPFISTASPVGPFDPLNIKPQIFSMDKYFALPIFTSLNYLQQFCRRFQFSVRDPSGELWADWRVPDAALLTPTNRYGSNPLVPFDAKAAEGADSASEPVTKKEDEHLATLERFNFSRCVPLPIFGPLVKPYLYGYFADIETLLHNINTIDEKVDVIVNPASALEFAISRDVTNSIVKKERVLQEPYNAVERDVRAELAIFFEKHCEEVIAAKSVCAPHHHSPTQTYLIDVEYDIVVLIHSVNFDATMSKLSEAKKHGLVIGHATLHFLNIERAPGHYVEAASLFFENRAFPTMSSREGLGLSQPPKAAGTLGAFKPMARGMSRRIATDVKPSSYFADRSLRYTEPHAVHFKNI